MANSIRFPTIDLTLAKGAEGRAPETVRVVTSHLIAYDQQSGFTRLKLIGGKWLDVKEPTDQIDRLIRAAASRVPLGFSGMTARAAQPIG